MNNQSWMHGFKLGARQLWRDLRAGELRLLMLSVALAVAALTAVGVLADRLQNGLLRDARQLVGGFSSTAWRLRDGHLHLAAFTATDDAGDQASQHGE